MIAAHRFRTSPWLRVLGAVLAALVAIGTPLATPTADAVSKGVTWKIDHTDKSITATIKLTLQRACTPDLRWVKEGGTHAPCAEVPATAAKEIKEAIEKVWNSGHRYYCYDIVVTVEVTVDNSEAAKDTPDRLTVRTDSSPAGIRSHVSGLRSVSAKSDGTGNTPNDELRADNFGPRSSTWGHPPTAATTYAHEAGHVLGLDDGYEDVKDAKGKVVGSKVRTGHARDLMSESGNTSIDKSTIRRMVERQGFKKTDLRCNYKVDRQVGPSKVTGLQCDPEGGIWTAIGVYQIAGATGDQAWDMTIDWTAKKGTFSYADLQTADFGIGNVTVRTEGQAAGRVTVTIDAELNAIMQLTQEAHSFRASIPGTPAWGEERGAPLQSSSMIWEPIGKCPPP